MARVMWAPHEEAYLRALITQFGPQVGEVIRAFREKHPERPETAIRSKYRHIRTAPQAPDESAAVQEWMAKRDAAVQEVAATRPVIEIVDLPPVPIVPVTQTPNPCYVLSSDHHWPLHDPRVEAIILQAIERLRPRTYLLDGDGPDMMALSRYPKDARLGHSWELREEQLHAKNWWREVWLRGQAWGMELVEIEANHSGNGTDSRWRRWLNENCAPLFGLDGFEELMTYQRFFHPPDVPVQMREEYVIAGDLRIRHGEIVRKHGGYSARAHGDKWQSSVLHGHTHRIGSSIKRRPGLPGVRPDEFLRTYEIGCACKLNPDYIQGADWANGFAIIFADDQQPGGYGIEQVQVINGRATSVALGGTLAA